VRQPPLYHDHQRRQHQHIAQHARYHAVIISDTQIELEIHSLVLNTLTRAL
jgi:hypothetical protein